MKTYYAATDSKFKTVSYFNKSLKNPGNTHWVVHSFNSKTDRDDFLSEHVNGTSTQLGASEAKQILKSQFNQNRRD